MPSNIDTTKIITTSILAGVVLVLALLVRIEANAYWKARLELSEKQIYVEAVDACLQAGRVSWGENGVTTQTPHQPSYQDCLTQKGY